MNSKSNVHLMYVDTVGSKRQSKLLNLKFKLKIIVTSFVFAKAAEKNSLKANTKPCYLLQLDHTTNNYLFMKM